MATKITRKAPAKVTKIDDPKSQMKETALVDTKGASCPSLSAFAASFKSFPKEFTTFPKLQNFMMEIDMMKSNKQFEKLAQDAAATGQEQMDALIKASTVLSKGMEDIVKVCMEIAQEAGEKNVAATKALMGCKTINELAEAQTRLAQASFDNFISNATRISEMSVKLATDYFQPINDQMGRAIKKATDSMAA